MPGAKAVMGRVERDNVRDIGGGRTNDIVLCGRGFSFHSDCNGEPEQDFEQRRNMD